MKLEAYNVISVHKCLVFTGLVFSCPLRPWRDAKRVAMPVKSGNCFRNLFEYCFAFRHVNQVHRKPSNFRFSVFAYLCAEHVSDELRAEAYPHDFFV